jgi:hypothetical protein
MAKPRRLSTRLDKEDRKQLKRMKSELGEAEDDDGGNTKSKASKKKKQKKAKAEEGEDEPKQRRSNKKRKLSADDEDGDAGAFLISITDGEQIAPDNKEKHKGGKTREAHNKKRKLNPAGESDRASEAAAGNENEDEEAVEAIDNKNWLSSITLYMKSPQSQLTSPVKVVFAFPLHLHMISGHQRLTHNALMNVRAIRPGGTT